MERHLHTVAELSLVRSKSLAQLVQREIERLILSGGIRPGEKLNEAIIAGRLGISRGPVRESFRTLEEMGLVRLEKNRGVFVREISAEEAANIYEIRAALEEAAGRRLARRLAPSQLAELGAMVERMDKVASAGDVEGFHPLNVEFHERLVEYAGNPALTAIYRRVINELALFRRHSLARGGMLQTSNAEHRVIIERLSAGNATDAGKAMYKHVMASGERMRSAQEHFFEAGRREDSVASLARAPKQATGAGRKTAPAHCRGSGRVTKMS
jgi:phosphonate utilization transcriptional regulator